MIKRIWRFLRYNNHKWMSLQCWFYSAIYRFQLLHMDTKKMQVKWGEEGKESPEDESMDSYRFAKKVGYCVDQICNKTSWESKCLVRALTAQTLLKKKGIHTTWYLGCKMENGKMAAHAWIRCGKMYVTGGNGEGYAVVDKFYM